MIEFAVAELREDELEVVTGLSCFSGGGVMLFFSMLQVTVVVLLKLSIFDEEDRNGTNHFVNHQPDPGRRASRRVFLSPTLRAKGCLDAVLGRLKLWWKDDLKSFTWV